MFLDKGFAKHKQDCRHLHNDTPWCNAKFRDGKVCMQLARVFADDYMPVCRQHQEKYIKASYCRAVQPCGWSCNRKVKWVPHLQVYFCDDHRTEAPCHFLEKLLLEIRYEIYYYLFPSRFLPAQVGIRSAILQVNRQISEEARVILCRQTQFGIEVITNTVTMMGICRARVPALYQFCDEPVSQSIKSFNQDSRQLVSPSSSTSSDILSPGATASATPSCNAWTEFPAKEPLWRQMRSFRIEIRPPSSEPEHTEDFKKRLTLLYDMTCRVFEHMEVIRPCIRRLDIVLNMYPTAEFQKSFSRDAQGRIIKAILDYCMPIWNVEQLKFYIAFTLSGQTSSMFDILGDPILKVGTFFHHDDTTSLQKKLMESRTQINLYHNQASSSLMINRPLRKIPRSALYQIEAAMKILYNPFISNFIPHLMDVVKRTHVLAIIAEREQDLQAFQAACGDMSAIFGTYAEAQTNLVGVISQAIQSAVMEPTKQSSTKEAS